MKTILINSNEIESCWEKIDACFIKTTSGKVWLCEKMYFNTKISTKNFIKTQEVGKIIELPLLKKGKSE